MLSREEGKYGDHAPDRWPQETNPPLGVCVGVGNACHEGDGKHALEDTANEKYEWVGRHCYCD